MLRRLKFIGALGAMLLLAFLVSAEQRFPPPDFDSGYRIPSPTTPAARQLWLQYADAGVFLAALGTAVWLIYQKRSRRGLFWLSLFSLAYFGFYRKGCICPIGSPQNVVYGLFNPEYAVPVTVLIFCFAPIVVALFAGRAFCAGVCPQGALQDFMLIKPVKVPPWLEQALSVVPFIFLGAGLIYAGTGTGFVVCRYDPFVPFFRLSGGTFILTLGAAFLLAGMFVGRPYCRFLCPYGGLLRLASLAAKWRVRVTPDTCTQCRLCEQSCPFGAMREPAPAAHPDALGAERRRLGWMLALLPVLVVAGAWAGSRLSPAAAQLHPSVALAERYVRQQTPGGIRLDDAGGAFAGARGGKSGGPFDRGGRFAPPLRFGVPLIWRLDRIGHRRQTGGAVGASGPDGLRAGPGRVFRLRAVLHCLPQ